MTTTQNLRVESHEQAEDLRGRELRFVRKDAEGRVRIADSRCPVVGVLVLASRGGPGAAVSVACGGTARVLAGAPVRPGSDVTSDDQGRAVPAGPGSRCLGHSASEHHAEVGQVVEVQLEL